MEYVDAKRVAVRSSAWLDETRGKHEGLTHVIIEMGMALFL
jgi:hypothetical protein